MQKNKLILLFFLLNIVKCWADTCTFSNETVTLPQRTSTSVFSTAVSNSGYAGILCPGLSSSTIVASDYVKSTLLSTTNNLLLRNSATGETIPYTLYSNSGFTNAFITGQMYTYSGNTLNSSIGTQGLQTPIYVRTTIGSNVSSGTYTDTANFSWDYKLCNQQGSGSTCIDSWTKTNQLSSVSITLVVNKTCSVTIPDANFGTASFIAQFNPVTQNMTITCTKTEGYVSYFNTGSNVSGSWNRMRTGSNYLQYNIYVPNTNTVWNQTNAQLGTGTGLAQTVPYQVKLNPAQSEQRAGSYTDTVIFTISY